MTDMSKGTYNYTPSEERNGSGTSRTGSGNAHLNGSVHSKRVANIRRILAGSTDPRPATTAATRDFISDVWDILDDAGNLLIRKHMRYGPNNIALAPGGPENGLRVRMWDKMARLNNLLNNPDIDPDDESLNDTLIDLLNYCAIFIMVRRGQWPTGTMS